MANVPESSFVMPVIQLAITPVILMSGLGGLLITLTNRYGRIVDRTRALAGQNRQTPTGADRTRVERQMHIMFRRAKLMRLSVTLAAISMLMSCLLIIVIFLSALLHSEAGWFIVSFFALDILFLVASIAAFIRDVSLSLEALSIEVTA